MVGGMVGTYQTHVSLNLPNFPERKGISIFSGASGFKDVE